MQWTGKLIGGALGLALGPIGAALGAAVGHQYDLMAERRTRPSGEQFFVSTFRLLGHVAKADGRVTEREIEAARQVMRSLRLDPAQVQAAIAEFTRGKQPDFDLDAEIADLRGTCHSQPEILRMFIEIQLKSALAGSDMGHNARARITRAAGLLGITPVQLARIEATLRGATPGGPVQDHAARTAAAYRTLEADPAVSNEELTKIYRRLLSRHHPDKLKANGLPDSMLEHAKQRTQAIKEAYELLRGQRGMG
ncbi:MAG TPA: co-chaperone DjlA [Steroidobacteraceae bacterium]|nr:co-chaperone DjlA [Steroidobacteraceae bacterium]